MTKEKDRLRPCYSVRLWKDQKQRLIQLGNDHTIRREFGGIGNFILAAIEAKITEINNESGVSITTV